MIAVGYVDSVLGYLPTSRVLAEGGYEAGEFCSALGLQGEFHPDVEGTVVDAVRDVLDCDRA